jgi:phosphatidylserine decarboxylase
MYRPGGWLPRDHRVHQEFLRRVIKHVDENESELTPALKEFQELIESEPRVYMYFVQMFEEIPQKHPYNKDPSGSAQIRDYKHMLAVLNHIVTRAPEWTDAAEAMGVVGVPMNALFDYPMGTPRYFGHMFAMGA